jgi:hypothetical protein
MCTIRRSAVILLMAGTFLYLGASGSRTASGQTQQNTPLYNPSLGGSQEGHAKHQQLQSESARLVQQYAKAEKEDDKKEIRKKLGDVIGQQFDLSLQEQQKELEDLEKQIADLRALLKKRRDSRTTIIDRRLEQIVQEAEGLGWNVPGARRSTGTQFGSPSSLNQPRNR